MNTASGRVPAAGLEQVERADRVDVEVVERARGGQIVARLGRGVDHQLVAAAAEQLVDRRPVADVDVDGACSERRWPRVAARFHVVSPAGPEEVGPHVVVDAVDGKPRRSKYVDRLGPDEPGADR